MHKIAFSFLVFIFLMNDNLKSQISFSEFGYVQLDAVDGAVLYSKEVTRGKNKYTVYCQVLDLKTIKLANFIDKSDKIKEGEGKYLAQKELSKSPYFTTYSFENALKQAQKSSKSPIIGMIHGVFFEEFNAATQLAFPIKNNGEILSAGSSPQGPCDNPKLPIFKDIQLKALVWTDSTIAIKNYDTQTGTPLTDTHFPNGFVTYQYTEHPAKLKRPLDADRFLVMGTFGMDTLKADNQLVILIVNRAGLEFAAAHLRQFGVKSDIIAIGGRATTLLYNKNKKILEPLGFSMTAEGLSKMQLPHFLFFTKKD